MNEGFRSRSDIMRAFIDAAARRFDIDRKELQSLYAACAGSDHRWVEARDWEPAVDFINERCPVTVYDWIDFGIDAIARTTNPVHRLLLQTAAPRSYLGGIPIYTKALSNHTEFFVRNIEHRTAIVDISTKLDYLRGSAGHSVFFQTGAVLSFFRVRGIPAGVTRVFHQPCLVDNILRRLYGRYRFRIEETEEEIRVDDKPLARKNVLIHVPNAGAGSGDRSRAAPGPRGVLRRAFRPGPGKAPDEAPAVRATRITHDLVHDGLVLLKRGEVFDAPFSRLAFSWGAEPIPSFLRRAGIAVRNALRPGRLATLQAEYLESSIATARDAAVKNDPALDSLTAREREVAELLCCGNSRREIAQRLCIALPTVKRHVESVYRKLGVHSRYELMALLNER